MSNTDSDYQNKLISDLEGVGPKYYSKLSEKLGLKSIFDLFFNIPFRYEDKTILTKIKDIQSERKGILVKAQVVSCKFVGPKKNILQVIIEDNTGTTSVTFFNTYLSFSQNFTKGKDLLLFGNSRFNEFSKTFELSHPEVVFLAKDEEIVLEKHLSPIYHLTDKLPQSMMRKIENESLKLLENNPLEEILNDDLNPYHLTLVDAIKQCHNPLPYDDHENMIIEKENCFKRLCFEELIAYQISLLKYSSFVSTKNSYSIQYNDEIQQMFLQNLPFSPTKAQLRVFKEICIDLQQTKGMQRLVHGDVGSGKTLIAMMTALQVYANNKQTVMMAPTELLALQHHYKFQSMLASIGVNVVLLYSGQSKTERNNTMTMIKNGSAHIIVGTHSVFQNDVEYHDLALAIIDEQHRFGIDQRKALFNKARNNIAIHQLSMTATPIPRTLQLALYSDINVSTIDELPQNRTPIQTAVISDDRRAEIIQRVRAKCREGAQAYWVCPLIEKGEDEDLIDVQTMFDLLTQNMPDIKIGMLHGQMNNVQKRSIMQDFLANKIQVLVATTVIEVGVDVPNASLMIIENAHRLGLAQLHQLRGRVGRGSIASFCILTFQNNNLTETATERLSIMKNSNNGFEIAVKDLELRGPGEIFGGQQAGFTNFKVADVSRDNKLLESARNCALSIIKDDILSNKFLTRWFPQYINSVNKGNS